MSEAAPRSPAASASLPVPSRGLGRGIARALGEAGATVIVTGRSSEAGPHTTSARRLSRPRPARSRRPAARAIPIVATTPASAMSTRSSPGACAASAGSTAWSMRSGAATRVMTVSVIRTVPASARRSGARLGESFEAGVYAQLLLARAVAPAMVQMCSGLIVTVSFDTAGGYLGDVFYDLAKAAMNRLSFAMAEELKPFGVTALGLSPGHVLTERVRDAGFGPETTETPLYAGRAVAALAADSEVARHAGRVLHVADLARTYGFTDRDGSQPGRFIIPNAQGGGDVAQG